MPGEGLSQCAANKLRGSNGESNSLCSLSTTHPRHRVRKQEAFVLIGRVGSYVLRKTMLTYRKGRVEVMWYISCECFFFCKLTAFQISLLFGSFVKAFFVMLSKVITASFKINCAS